MQELRVVGYTSDHVVNSLFSIQVDEKLVAGGSFDRITFLRPGKLCVYVYRHRHIYITRLLAKEV